MTDSAHGTNTGLVVPGLLTGLQEGARSVFYIPGKSSELNGNSNGKDNDNVNGNGSIINQTSISIYNAFAGNKLIVPYSSITTMDDLKNCIAQCFGIDVERLFLLTPFGIKLRFEMLTHEQIHEIYVFDRKFFNPTLVMPDRSDDILKELLASVENRELITLVKPREAPLLANGNETLDKFVDQIESLVSIASNKDKERVLTINSTDLDFDTLRLFLNLLKRNSGWASALLADMKSTLFNKVYQHDYEIVENILEAFNSLIQYISTLFNNLKKQIQAASTVYKQLATTTLANSWRTNYETLKGVSFSFYGKKLGTTRQLALADLIDIKNVEDAAIDSNLQRAQIDTFFQELEDSVNGDIKRQRDLIFREFEAYKSLFLKPEWEVSESDNIKAANRIYNELDIIVSEMTGETNRIPSFEELIQTSSQTSTNLSSDSIEKIIHIIKLYQSQKYEYTPEISRLSKELYQIQSKFCKAREELQGKIINTSLLYIVRIQLLIREANKILDAKVSPSIEKMQAAELQMSLVTNLPLIFGMWVISALSNKKYGESINKLLHKTHEIFEMMNYMEQNDRSKWLVDFIESGELEKFNLSFLNKSEYRNLLTQRHIAHFTVTSNDHPPSSVEQPKQALTKRHSDTVSYLSSFNKLVQNINMKRPEMANHHSENGQVLLGHRRSSAKDTDLIYNSSWIYFEELVDDITIKDVYRYFQNIEVTGIDKSIVEQLRQYMLELGIQGNDYHDNDGGLLVKSGNLEDIGSLDLDDAHFMNLFHKFIRSFQMHDMEIKIEEVKGMHKTSKLKVRENARSVNSSDDDDGVDDYSDAIKLKVYKAQIQKLESLLFEKKYNMFHNKWATIDARDYIERNINNDVIKEADFVEDAIGEVTRLPPSHYFEKIKDLRRENQQLQGRLSELERMKEVEEMIKLKRMIDSQKNDISSAKIKLEEKEKEKEEKDLTIEGMQRQIQMLKRQNEKLVTENQDLKGNVQELAILNKDLLENLSQKESELMNENQQNQKEKNALELKIEELVDINLNYEKLVNKFQSTDDLVARLIHIISFCLQKMQALSNEMHSHLGTFCLVLEIMGLLLVYEKEGYEIQRVKGLRATKKSLLQDRNGHKIEFKPGEDQQEGHDTDFSTTDDKLFMNVVASTAYELTIGDSKWVPDIEDVLSTANMRLAKCKDSSSNYDKDGISTKNEDRDKALHESRTKEIEETIDSLCDYEMKLKTIVETLSPDALEPMYEKFTSIVTIPPQLLLERIHKRFEDVESLARKLQREKGQLKADLKSINKQASQRLVLHGFQKGDLVLFLRAFVPQTPGKTPQKSSPWTVFNVGSPNYYLKVKNGNAEKMNDREWFVGRIKNIEKSVINAQNIDSLEDNPFNLNVGTVWYFVEATEDPSQLAVQVQS